MLIRSTQKSTICGPAEGGPISTLPPILGAALTTFWLRGGLLHQQVVEVPRLPTSTVTGTMRIHGSAGSGHRRPVATGPNRLT
jgi:hypothetical protein